MTAGREERLWRVKVALVTALIFFGGWELLGQVKALDPQMMSWPSQIVIEWAKLIRTSSYWNDLSVSGLELLSGYGIALLGVPIGLAVGYWRWANDSLDPVFTALYSTPKVALTPLFIIWFGLGLKSKIALAALNGIFPVILNAAAGVHGVDLSLIRAARSFGASQTRIVREVVLPASLPFVVTGLRLGLGRALIGVVIGEMLAAKAGLGFRIKNAAANFQTAEFFVALLTVILIALLLSEVIQRFENRWIHWKH